jgi:hypothetical protein
MLCPQLSFSYYINHLSVIPAKAGTQGRWYDVAWCAPEHHESTGWEEPNPGNSIPASLGPGSPLRAARPQAGRRPGPRSRDNEEGASGRDDSYPLPAAQFSSQNQLFTRHPRESGDPGSLVQGCVITRPNGTRDCRAGAQLGDCVPASLGPGSPLRAACPRAGPRPDPGGRDDGEGAAGPESRISKAGANPDTCHRKACRYSPLPGGIVAPAVAWPSRPRLRLSQDLYPRHRSESGIAFSPAPCRNAIMALRPRGGASGPGNRGKR